MKARTNISLKERRSLTLGDFKGVDFSSSPLNVRGDRASNMRNFINEYGVNKKRNGWKELLEIKAAGVVQSINGIFEYVNGNHREMLVHAGKGFYRVENTDGEYSCTKISLSSNISIKDQRSQAFFNKGRMYIIGCGDYLVYGSWDGGGNYELRRVANNEDTYIPTTTISIDPDGVNDNARVTLDGVNCLSDKRINRLLGSDSDSEKTWTLDASIDDGTTVEIKVETVEAVEGEGGNEVAVEYIIKNNQKEKDKLYKVKKNNEDIKEENSCGSLDYSTGKITLDFPTTPQISNRDNIYVTFEHKVEGYEKRITECSFGTLFGVNGNTDSLFLSGNPDYPNIDFYSEAEDFTYFSDQNSAALGSDKVPIKGYARLSDSTLAVFKAETTQDTSIFYRTGSYREFYDDNGNLDKIIRVFSSFGGNIGVGAVNSYTCANFDGDKIFLSTNGVFGVETQSSITTEKYAKERSRSINERLKHHQNLSEAVGIVYKNRYYLAVDDVCYVADSRYKYIAEDNADGSYNYEWWFWDNIPARVWANIDNKLYFGSKDGKICVFDDKYTDRTYVTDESLTIVGNGFVKADNLELSEDDEIVLFDDNVYGLVLKNAQIKNRKIKTSEEDIFSFREKMEVYVDNVGDSGLCVGKVYYVSDIDVGSCTFSLKDENGIDVEISAGSFNLYCLISGVELYVTNVSNDSYFQVKRYKGEATPISIVSYNNQRPTEIKANITHSENVVAEWFTPVLDLGTNVSSKTLLGMTICTEPEINGKISLGYETRKVSKLIAAKGINVFSFNNFSFENFTFSTEFANSYSVRCNERNFNFIIFRFVSDNDANCAVNNFTVNYKINKSNRGVN